MNILKGRRDFSGGEGSGGLPFILHANLGSNSFVRRKLRMGAKTVGSLSMKICGEGVRRMNSAERGVLSLLLPAAAFQLLLYSRLRSHLSVSRCVRSEDCREGTQRRCQRPGCVCVRGGEIRSPHTFSSCPSTPTPNLLSQSPGEE